MSRSDRIVVGTEVRQALEDSRPLVSLETAVVTHGLPEPENLEALQVMEEEVRQAGAVPATCLLRGGLLRIGASTADVADVASDPHREKITVRDLGAFMALGASGGLTVSATLFASALIGIRVFATGGIGGVHLGARETDDVSTDLLQLSRSPVVAVCSGAKSVLDIPRTLERLESLGVPVFTYRATEFPAFYLLSSGIHTACVDSPGVVAAIARAQWELGYDSAVLVANPIPPAAALPPGEWEAWIDEARQRAESEGVRGKDVTPFLLSRVAETSGSRTVRANLALLRNNAHLAGQIARALGS